MFAAQLRAAAPSPSSKADANAAPNVAALQAELQAQREAHSREVAKLRAEFEAALAEEARQTRLAVDAIARQHQEALQRERTRLREELRAEEVSGCGFMGSGRETPA